MSRKVKKLNLEAICETLQSHSFSVAPSNEVAGAVLVTKNGAAAVLLPAVDTNAPPAFAVLPGLMVHGQIARLVDRGFQKFFATTQFEIPATASQLQALHSFEEELNQLAGCFSRFNQALGTTSDLYQYDRLKGRERLAPAAARPWELAGGH